MRALIGKSKEIISYSLNRDRVPLFYFDGTLNVGDVLNAYLVSKIANRDIFFMKHRARTHLLAIGSIMHFGTKKSHVWGSGIIQPSQMPSTKVLSEMTFHAVRGELTRELLEERGLSISGIPLGDPAVLTRLFYTPNSGAKRYKIGIVPHFVDYENPLLKEFRERDDILIINVRQPPEPFLDQLAACDCVLSSSLHGLILADTYNIPNKWVRFSDKVIGGDFKFLDYYSTTYSRTGEASVISQESDIFELIKNIEENTRVNKYRFDSQELLDAFPKLVI